MHAILHHIWTPNVIFQDHSHHSEDEAEDIPEKPALPLDREKKSECELLNQMGMLIPIYIRRVFYDVIQ